MNWILLTLASAVLLGLYDFVKKLSLKDNAVPIVLLASVCVAASLWTPLIIWSHLSPHSFPTSLLLVRPLESQGHFLLAAKSLLVGTSWSLAFAALKHLPLSIAGPIRSTSPLWTIVIAVMFFAERPQPGQWVGVIVILLSFYAFSLVGMREGIRFHRDRWVLCMLAATVLGAISSIYDKYLLQTVALDVATVQAWFSVYLVPVMLPWALQWAWKDRKRTPFRWKPTIPLIAIALLLADFCYFSAIDQPGALIAVISPVRRTSLIIPFAIGILFFGERNGKAKGMCVLGLLLGVFLISLSS